MFSRGELFFLLIWDLVSRDTDFLYQPWTLPLCWPRGISKSCLQNDWFYCCSLFYIQPKAHVFVNSNSEGTSFCLDGIDSCRASCRDNTLHWCFSEIKPGDWWCRRAFKRTIYTTIGFPKSCLWLWILFFCFPINKCWDERCRNPFSVISRPFESTKTLWMLFQMVTESTTLESTSKDIYWNSLGGLMFYL